MASSFINDPEHWHQRAAEGRTLADKMNDDQSKQTMLRIAADYEQLAERAKQRSAGIILQKPKGSAFPHR